VKQLIITVEKGQICKMFGILWNFKEIFHPKM